MNTNINYEATNLDILEKLQEKLEVSKDKKVEPKKDEYAMLQEDYLNYAK